MSQHKLLTDIKDEDLEKLLDETKENSQPIDDNQYTTIWTFLNKFKVKPGPNPISKKFLYKLYEKNSLIPVSYLTFNRFLCKFFLFNDNYYYINHEPIIFKDHLQKKRKKVGYHPNQVKKYKGFCQLLNLQQGTYKVPIMLIYNKYKNYYKDKKTLSFGPFSKLLKIDYKYYISNKIIYIGVNHEQRENNFPEEQIKEFEKETKKRS